VLSVLMHCFAITCVSSLLWLVLAYSIAFGGDGTWWGGLSKSFLSGVGVDTLFGDIPESVFFMFQMTFAIITPGLIVGAYVERIKFSAVVIFSGLWLIVVYAPSAHWIWGGGLLSDLSWAGLEGYATMDFAGGLVVHANAGVAALLIAKVLGPRRGFPNELRPPHNPGMVMIGAAMLWVGWFGFNAGSALAADGSAGMAMTVTHISAATACLVWITIEWIKFGKPSLVGIATGAIAGLATITPGSGFVGPAGALVYGFLAGIICFFAINLVKQAWKIDDSLDVFAVHGVGGILGILLTGIFADASFGGVGLPEGVTIGTAFLGQLIAVAVTIVWAAIAGYIIIKITQAIVGLRVDEDDESEGLDLTEHGERGYDL
jgi:Amt family ammonium transporter